MAALLFTFGCNFPGADAFAAKGGKKDIHSNAPPKTPPDTTSPDTTVPVVTITAQPNSLYNNRNITIQFSATDNSTSTLTYQCQIDSGALAACTTNTSFTVPSTLAEGAHTIRVRVTDAAGNIGTATSSAFTLDVTAPTISTLTGPANCTVGSCTNSVAFSTSDALSAPVTATCAINSAAAATCTSPYVVSTTILNTVGAHTISVTAQDRAGNVATRTHSFTIAAVTTTPPPPPTEPPPTEPPTPTPSTTYSPYQLQIIQPAANLDINNRFYRAHPGLEYNVRLAVIGGAYPYTFTVNGPAGLTIHANTGVISWPSPTESTTPYPVNVTVTDSLNAKQTVAWSITVTKNGFLFVDAVNGTSGAAGTFDAPMKTFLDVYGGNTYESKYDTKNQNKFVYFKNGSYFVDGYTGGGYGVQYTNRQPVVLMAYPGHKPRLDMSEHCLHMDTTTDNMYIEGLEVTPISGPELSRFGFRLAGNSKHVTFRNNHFHNLTPTTGSYNQSVIMANSVTSGERGHSWSIQNNIFSDIQYGYGIIGYTIQNVLIEDNKFYNNNGHSIGPKVNTTRWFIRHNDLRDNKTTGIWLYYATITSGYMSGDYEVSYNFVRMTSDRALSVNQSDATSGLKSHIFRNTFVGNVVFESLSTGFDNINFYDNVVINENSTKIQCLNCSAPAKLVLDGNLTGSGTSGIVNLLDGTLTSTYSNYLGQTGFQIGD